MKDLAKTFFHQIFFEIITNAVKFPPKMIDMIIHDQYLRDILIYHCCSLDLRVTWGHLTRLGLGTLLYAQSQWSGNPLLPSTTP